ncbi:MAG: type III pantothenate kinase [Candidatus Methylopumilus sp.]|nr:type III pantothenate kinase [Candidatus Methylopumilus sp.]
MFLLIDIGNTKTKWMLRDNRSIYKQDSFFTEDIDQDHFRFDKPIQKILISNVAGFEKEAILKIKLKFFSCPIEFIKPQKNICHLINHYQDPHQLGADRWLSALSLSQDHYKNVVIASIGTAVTVDLLTYDKNSLTSTFEGGVILPGLHLTKDILSSKTSDLKKTHGEFHSLPQNTSDAIESGFILSVLGNIKFFFDLALTKTKEVSIVLSGGDAYLVHQHMDENIKKYVSIKKDLVLEGLFVLAKL